ncbi:MAG: AraC family transcriptional regulator [Ruminococcaceae bacterium]|nr:AraC family transcriptional regulator [Oscillospiraceae bacterium]
MYVNAGYLTGPQVDYEDLSRPFIVSSCGTYRMLTVPRYENCYRGRGDYQLLLVAAGQAYFDVDGAPRTVTAGHMVLYRPGEPQRYIYCAADGAVVYWVHFTGSEAAEVLAHYGIKGEDKVFPVGDIPSAQRLLDRIIRELQLWQPGYEEMTVLHLRRLLLQVMRHRQSGGTLTGDILSELHEAQVYLSEHYREPIDIAAYAASRHMSVSWFIRSFREQVGVTPLQYVLGIRLANAQALLLHSTDSVARIAALVGYDDPLYFSRLFRQRVGMTPTEYRRRYTKEPPS